MLRRLSALLIAGLVLASCGSSPPPPVSFPDLRYNLQPPIRLAVGVIRIASTFEPTLHWPQVEQSFPVPPQRAVLNWAHDRLLATDKESPYIARVTVRDASVREVGPPEDLSRDDKSVTDHQERYEGRVAAKVEIIDYHGTAIRTADAESYASRIVPAGTTLNARDQEWYDMTQEMVGNLTRELERQIDATFAPYVQ